MPLFSRCLTMLAYIAIGNNHLMKLEHTTTHSSLSPCAHSHTSHTTFNSPARLANVPVRSLACCLRLLAGRVAASTRHGQHHSNAGTNTPCAWCTAGASHDDVCIHQWMVQAHCNAPPPHSTRFQCTHTRLTAAGGASWKPP